MRKHSGPKVKVKAAGGVRTLTELLKLKDLGISRCGATATASCLKKLLNFSIINDKLLFKSINYILIS